MSYNDSPISIRAENLSKTYLLYASPQDRLKQFLIRGGRKFFREVEALKNVSFTVHKGEALGIIGRNGSGKSTLLQMLCGIVTPTLGSLEVEGRISALLELGAGFNPEFTGRENVYLNATILGLSREAIEARMEDILNFAGIGHFIDQPVKTYSSGMYVRLAFAVSVAIEPGILIVDEALAVGDEAFQRKCYARIRQLKERGTTILFVSHASQTVVDLCDRAILLDGGEMLLYGTPKQVVANYHKLIYADPARQPALRQALKSGKTAILEREESEPPLPETSPTPESRIEYPPQGARIHHPHITTLDGTPTNLLHCGESYQYRFCVTADEDIARMKFGMLIKTVTGFELGGASGGGEGRALPLLKAGETIEAIFTFHCLLRSGSYFLNCGCTREVNGEDRFIHRIIDAVQFRVVHESSDTATVCRNGLVDFGITARVLRKHPEQGQTP